MEDILQCLLKITKIKTTEYQPPTGGTTEQEIRNGSLLFSCPEPGERRTQTCHALTMTLTSFSAATASQPLPPLPTKAVKGCFPSTTRSRNTIPIKAKSSTQKSCEAAEKQWNAQLARRIILAIPRELPPAQQAGRGLSLYSMRSDCYD